VLGQARRLLSTVLHGFYQAQQASAAAQVNQTTGVNGTLRLVLSHLASSIFEFIVSGRGGRG
jgi:hypothetical protein